MPLNLSQHRETMGRFNNHNVILGRAIINISNILLDIAFGVATILIFFLSLCFGVFVCNDNKIFLFSRFRKIELVFVSIFVFTFFVCWRYLD